MPIAREQSHGISRARFAPRPLTIAGRPDPGALAEDVRSLERAHDGIVRHHDETVNRLTKRMNEMILSGTLAERPDAGTADRIYLVVVDHTPGPLYFDDGTQWVLIGSPTLETHRAVLADGDFAHTFTVTQSDAIYTPSFSTTWWTMTKISTQTASTLTVEFSNPATAGDVVTVVIP